MTQKELQTVPNISAFEWTRFEGLTLEQICTHEWYNKVSL